jgi:hypothetical protein
MSPDEVPLFCDHCSRELHPGRGDFYIVKIEAVADPSPPLITADDLAQDPRREIEQLIALASRQSERELEEQVHRRVVLYLCVACYAHWIENPTNA